jgi:hypothetical protein
MFVPGSMPLHAKSTSIPTNIQMFVPGSMPLHAKSTSIPTNKTYKFSQNTELTKFTRYQEENMNINNIKHADYKNTFYAIWYLNDHISICNISQTQMMLIFN